MDTTEIEYAANEAVFGLQLENKQAIKFIVRNANTDAHTARQVLAETLTSYNKSLGGNK